MKVRRNDEGRGQRRRWVFFSNLLRPKGTVGILRAPFTGEAVSELPPESRQKGKGLPGHHHPGFGERDAQMGISKLFEDPVLSLDLNSPAPGSSSQPCLESFERSILS